MTWEVREDDGLASMLSRKAPDSAFDPLSSPAILQIVRDVLQTALAAPDRRWALDPFSPSEERYRLVERVLGDAILADRSRGGPLGVITPESATLRALYAATLGWGPAQRYLDDPRVTEVKIAGVHILVQEIGKPFARAPERFDSKTDVLNRALLLAAMLGIRLDAANPQESLPVSHSTRVHVTIPPRSRDSALVCIRRGRVRPWRMRDVQERGMVNQDIADLLLGLVNARCSCLIVGRTGSGKTALLESLINSAPGSPHVVVIEDQVSEIRVDEDTRIATYLTANTVSDPTEYARVVREALRQTPDIACPGETRGVEAAATIQLAMTGHMVMTTMHAVSPESAITRLASLAASLGSPFYEGRYQDALHDAIESFPIVIVVRMLESHAHYGRRVVETIAAVDGLDERLGLPRFVTLADVRETDDSVEWDVHAEIDERGRIRMRDGRQLPRSIAARQRFASSSYHARTAMLTQEWVNETERHAQRLLIEGNPVAAMSLVNDAWTSNRQDHEWSLVAIARSIIDSAPHLFAQDEARAREVSAALERAVQRCEWREAQTILTQRVLKDIRVAALATPEMGWAEMERMIRIGIEQDNDIRRRLTDAHALCEAGAFQRALSVLETLDVDRMSATLATETAQVRLRALQALHQRGQVAHAVIAAAELRVRALMQRGMHADSPSRADALAAATSP